MTQDEEKIKASLIDPSLVAFTALALITGALCYARGQGVFLRGLDDAVAMMWQVLPKVVGALLMAGFVQVLLPDELVVKWIGKNTGFKGIMIACLVGALTPGGPMLSFPLVAALYRMGANISSLVAYLTAWELVGVQRILIWDLPLMGVKFTALRVAVSFFLPALAGMIAQKVADFFDGTLAGGDQ
jgi:uncharacterized membrane protein YraQ (UPF0718 family)